MKITFSLDADNEVECILSNVTGLEIYKLNGDEVFRTRNFKPYGSRQFIVNVNGQEREIKIQLRFQPFRNIFKSTSFIAQVYIDGELFIDNLLAAPYWYKNKFTRILDKLAIASMFIFFTLFIAAIFFYELFPQAESVKVINATLATSECLAVFPEMDKSLMLPERVAVKLRVEEMNRKHDWVTSGGRSVLDIVTSGYGTSRTACQQSRLELLDQYLANGANINTVRSNFMQLTVLQDAIMMIDLPLICELLKRGASTDIKVMAYHHDGTASNITGLTTYELPSFLGKKMNDPAYQEILKIFDVFKDTKHCQI